MDIWPSIAAWFDLPVAPPVRQPLVKVRLQAALRSASLQHGE